ncbi:hypothetical protein [Streptomyces sp. NPDC089919]|uniref:hypothetical protein n=1 Tax=Streptomyces sp. NPDC089919 TaxID=3155188 RepID=UPI003442AF34
MAGVLAAAVSGCSGERAEAGAEPSGSPGAARSDGPPDTVKTRPTFPVPDFTRTPLPERPAAADEMARRSLRLAATDARGATALAMEAAGLGHSPTVVKALKRLASPYLVQYLAGEPGDGTYTVLTNTAVGRIVVGGSTTGTVTAWDTYTGRRRLHQRLGAPVQRVVADGGLVAARTAAGEIAVWELTGGRRVVTDTVPVRGNSGLAFLFSRNHRLFAYGKDAGVVVKDTRSWNTTATLPAGPAGSVGDLTPIIHPTRLDAVLAGVRDGVRLRLWDLASRTELPSVALSDPGGGARSKPHVFGPQSMSDRTVLSGGGYSRVLRLDARNFRDVFAKEEVLSPLAWTLSSRADPMAGDGAGDDESTGATGNGSPHGGILMAAISADFDVVAVPFDDRRRVFVQFNYPNTDLYPGPERRQDPYLVAPAGRTITAVAAWSAYPGPQAALALDDGRVAVWNFGWTVWGQSPDRGSLDEELRRLCETAALLPAKDEWARWAGPAVPYRPICPVIAKRGYQGGGSD